MLSGQAAGGVSGAGAGGMTEVSRRDRREWRSHCLDPSRFKVTQLRTARLRPTSQFQQFDTVVVLQKRGLELVDFRTLEG